MWDSGQADHGKKDSDVELSPADIHPDRTVSWTQANATARAGARQQQDVNDPGQTVYNRHHIPITQLSQQGRVAPMLDGNTSPSEEQQEQAAPAAHPKGKYSEQPRTTTALRSPDPRPSWSAGPVPVGTVPRLPPPPTSTEKVRCGGLLKEKEDRVDRSPIIYNKSAAFALFAAEDLWSGDTPSTSGSSTPHRDRPTSGPGCAVGTHRPTCLLGQYVCAVYLGAIWDGGRG